MISYDFPMMFLCFGASGSQKSAWCLTLYGAAGTSSRVFSNREPRTTQETVIYHDCPLLLGASPSKRRPLTFNVQLGSKT